MGDRPLYLDRRGNYTRDPKSAMRGLPSEQEFSTDRGAEQARQFAGLEPECVDPAIVDELGLSRAHKERYRSEKALELKQRDNRTRSAQLRALQTDALKAGVDIGVIERVIDAKIDEGRRMLKRAA
jgi:hypothetical protein